MKFRILIERDETGYYVAEVPALPGCLSQGRSRAEARRNVKEAIAGWLEVMNSKVKNRRAETLTPFPFHSTMSSGLGFSVS